MYSFAPVKNAVTHVRMGKPGYGALARIVPGSLFSPSALKEVVGRKKG